ncbi:MAG TPA: helicase-related protein, partial [Methanocorpusculum sp.]|nr:helicase-related protein [Methanocorpusculum sp.]
RVYKSNNKNENIETYSMDNVDWYGDEIYNLSFGDAVDQKLLSDYKVLVLTMTGADITPSIRKMIEDSNSNLTEDDAIRIVGCLKALSKQITDKSIGKETGVKSIDDGIQLDAEDPQPMRRAVAFCQNIKISKDLQSLFSKVCDAYISDLRSNPETIKDADKLVSVETRHIDGGMRSTERDDDIQWLKNENSTDKLCRILMNVRCLSEGVDVPSLDSIMFLASKRSEIDIVQAVGRVMRKLDGKKYGYIILPLVFNSDDPVREMNENPGNYKVIWDVLNAMRSHDERLTREIELMKFSTKTPQYHDLSHGPDPDSSTQLQKHILIARGSQNDLGNLIGHYDRLKGHIVARMIEKVGDRDYLGTWATKIVGVANKLGPRLTSLVNTPSVLPSFKQFVKSLQTSINPNVDESQAIDMLTQHILTKPIFKTLFADEKFTQSNPVSNSLDNMVKILEDHGINKETEDLNVTYKRIQERIKDYPNKQEAIRCLYSDFFTTAFKKLSSQIGIAYTPIEIVDFILHSVDDVLKEEFGRSISDENVHVLDPFTGTGSFIVRLFEKGLIKSRDLERKYNSELHANEISLLPYYISAINIENSYYSSIPESKPYTPFKGICLTDTFQIDEWDDREHIDQNQFPLTSDQVDAQKNTPIQVIIGNPPYSIGQKTVNDNAQNMKYPKLDERITQTYAKDSKATSKKSLYDSYIKAIRWSTDRLDRTNGGIIGFITNGGWLD